MAEAEDSLPLERSRFRRWLPVLAPVVLAAILFVFAVSSYPPLPMLRDALGYTATAQRLVADRTFAYGGLAQTEPNAAVAPGYVAFLAVFYGAAADAGSDPVAWARAVQPWVISGQFILSLLLVGLTALCGRRLGGDQLAALAGFLAALYLPFGWASSVALSDLLGAALLTGQLFVALELASPRSKPSNALFVLLGVVAACTALVRPAYALWGVIPLAYLGIARASEWRFMVRKVGFFAIAFVLVMCPWWVRNALEFREFIPLSSGSGAPFLDSVGGLPMSPEEEAVASEAEAEGRDGLKAAAMYRTRTRWAESPTRFAADRAKRVWRMLAVPSNAPMDTFWSAREDEASGRAEWILFAAPPARYTPALIASSYAMLWYQRLLLIAAIVSVAFVGRSRRLLLALSVPVYGALVHLVTLPLNRYLLPAMPALIVCAAAAGYGIYVVTRRAMKARSLIG